MKIEIKNEKPRKVIRLLKQKNEIIKQINMMGDYFLVGDIDNRLLLPLRNVPYTKESVEKALPNRVDDIILNLDKKDLIEMIFNA